MLLHRTASQCTETASYAEQNVTVSMSDLGENLKAYLGKSFYDDDMYFRGFFDNVKVYDFAMGSDEVEKVYQQEEADRIAMLEDVQRVADTFEIPNMDNVKGTLPFLLRRTE